MKSVLLIFVTTPLVVHQHLKSLVRSLSAVYQVSIITNLKDCYSIPDLPCKWVHIGVRRKPSIADLYIILKLYRLKYSYKPAVFISFTPKCGLMNAFTFSPSISIHYFTGQVWASRTGVARAVLKFFDFMTLRLVRNILCDSFSQRQFLVDEYGASARKIGVLGSGSLVGVDIKKFSPDANKRQALRRQYGISPNDFVFLFLGRVCADKGVFTLIDAFNAHVVEYPSSWLVIVGPIEEKSLDFLRVSTSHHVVYVPFTNDPSSYFQFSDILVMPSKREGFCTTVIEAAACGVPSIGTDIVGLRDSIVQNKTGVLVPEGDIKALVVAMGKMVCDAELRHQLATNAKSRATLEYSSDKVVGELCNYIYSLDKCR